MDRKGGGASHRTGSIGSSVEGLIDCAGSLVSMRAQQPFDNDTPGSLTSAARRMTKTITLSPPVSVVHIRSDAGFHQRQLGSCQHASLWNSLYAQCGFTLIYIEGCRKYIKETVHFVESSSDFGNT